MMITLLYIVIAIMAFVFAVTTSNTIEKSLLLSVHSEHQAIQEANY